VDIFFSGVSLRKTLDPVRRRAEINVGCDVPDISGLEKETYLDVCLTPNSPPPLTYKHIVGQYCGCKQSGILPASNKIFRESERRKKIHPSEM
jgi:hypothetical protein